MSASGLRVMPSRRVITVAALWLFTAAPGGAAQPPVPGGAGAPRTAPAKPFEPSEKIPPGTPVPFPVDI